MKIDEAKNEAGLIPLVLDQLYHDWKTGAHPRKDGNQHRAAAARLADLISCWQKIKLETVNNGELTRLNPFCFLASEQGAAMIHAIADDDGPHAAACVQAYIRALFLKGAGVQDQPKNSIMQDPIKKAKFEWQPLGIKINY